MEVIIFEFHSLSDEYVCLLIVPHCYAELRETDRLDRYQIHIGSLSDLYRIPSDLCRPSVKYPQSPPSAADRPFLGLSAGGRPPTDGRTGDTATVGNDADLSATTRHRHGNGRQLSSAEGHLYGPCCRCHGPRRAMLAVSRSLSTPKWFLYSATEAISRPLCRHRRDSGTAAPLFSNSTSDPDGEAFLLFGSQHSS